MKYEIGIFKKGEDEAVANGHFVHVFVQRNNNKPTSIPEKIRKALETL